MSLGPMNVGDTAPEIQAQVKRGTNTYPLTGFATTAIKIHLYLSQAHRHKFGKGTVAFTDAPQGKFAYAWHREDTDTPGVWDVWIEIIDSNGRSITSTNTESLQITSRERGYNKHAIGRLKVMHV